MELRRRVSFPWKQLNKVPPFPSKQQPGQLLPCHGAHTSPMYEKWTIPSIHAPSCPCALQSWDDPIINNIWNIPQTLRTPLERIVFKELHIRISEENVWKDHLQPKHVAKWHIARGKSLFKSFWSFCQDRTENKNPNLLTDARQNIGILAQETWWYQWPSETISPLEPRKAIGATVWRRSTSAERPDNIPCSVEKEMRFKRLNSTWSRYVKIDTNLWDKCDKNWMPFATSWSFFSCQVQNL